MGHGTSHNAKVTYSQMQTQMDTLGYKNVFIGTVEGEPEETACENVIEAVKAAGYKKVILRPLMVVAGDHANNDMAGLMLLSSCMYSIPRQLWTATAFRTMLNN